MHGWWELISDPYALSSVLLCPCSFAAFSLSQLHPVPLFVCISYLTMAYIPLLVCGYVFISENVCVFVCDQACECGCE